MKKFLKILGSILLILTIIITGVLFYFRHQVGIYINLGREYVNFKEEGGALETFNNLNLSNTTMDYRDVVYKKDDGTNCTLDIYGPKKTLKNGSPVILYVHGGSWLYGSKDIPEALSPLLNVFRNEGYTIISVGYRKDTTKFDFYNQVSDVKDAIRWVYKNHEKYNFNTNDIGVIGASAGAQLSLLATYSDNKDFLGSKALENYPSKVKYVIDLFGPTNLNSLNMRGVDKGLETAIKNTENSLKGETVKAYMNKYSPINYIKKGEPKTLIIHGTNDKLVPFKESENFYNKSKEMGNNVQLLPLKNCGHDFKNIDKKEASEMAFKLLNFIIFNTSF